MSEIKHTPGPWITAKVAKVTPDKTQVVWAVISPKRGATNPVSGLSPLFPASEQEANAYLIAAAPELLESLEAMVEADRMGNDPDVAADTWEQAGRAALDLARVALAKAKRETNE